MYKLATLSALAVLVIASVAAVAVQKQEPPKRLAKIEHLMQGIVHPAYLTLEKGINRLVDAGEFQPAAWKPLSTNAILLNEASFLLVDADRSRGKDWDSYASELREHSATLLNDVNARDLPGITASFKNLSATCVKCHADYR